MPIEPGAWDRPLCAERRSSGYGAQWGTTIRELANEAGQLGANEVVIGLAVDRSALRLDGYPKSGVDVPDEVIVYLPASAHGPLRFLSDRWWKWQHNVRAVVLTLQRLRLVTESGVAQSGEQYRGWQALPPGRPGLAGGMTFESARALLREAAGDVAETAGMDVDELYRRAAKRHHPDRGGDAVRFAQVTAARDLLVSSRG